MATNEWDINMEESNGKCYSEEKMIWSERYMKKANKWKDDVTMKQKWSGVIAI